MSQDKSLKAHLHWSALFLKTKIASLFCSVQEAPIFVLGNQKSGTTAIAALLAEFANLTATLDLAFITSTQIVKMYNATMSVDTFVNRHQLAFSKDLIKEPHLTFMYDSLHNHFPKASFILVVRDPRSNIRSILNRLKIPGDLPSILLQEWKEINDQWCPVLDGSWMGLTGTTYIEMLAARWNRAVDIYLSHQDTIQFVRYEDFAADKLNVIRQLALHLGLPETNDITPRLDHPFQPVGNRSISWIDFFGAQNLHCIEQMCASRMERLGYDTNS